MMSNTGTEACIHTNCGGCAYQGVSYEEQLSLKDAGVRKILEKSGLLDCEYLGIDGSSSIYAYRNKMDYTFGDEFKGGETTLGMHRRKSFWSVVTTDSCMLVDSDFNIVLAAVLSFCKEKGYPVYRKKDHVGLLRYLVIRKGMRTNELLINIVSSSQGSFDIDELTSRLLSLDLHNKVTGILHTIDDKLADFVYCDELRVIYGNDYYEEEVLSLRFKVHAFSFFQTNVIAAERLYRTALSWIEHKRAGRALDLYCGAGTITQAIAKSADYAAGVEISPDAVRSARENAGLNALDNCSFIEGDVLEVLDGLSADDFDLITLDPPRVGVHPKALNKIMKFGAERILYISCNPQSMANDLMILRKDYTIEKIQAFDNFPFTKHVEAAVLLERRL
ncbi:MAG: 23S rRNA (uracil(1939)-C(5))-methyltransferase RlmD [Clostridiales Family XIII bacterium]|jgi:23S rRNA (uracil-5-)-methyltransferase RumA|nr:23S rRNA (uracil(1939)-C(5))-methyltransferase RlmD [Clostridiales Family XIII bacterium]